MIVSRDQYLKDMNIFNKSKIILPANIVQFFKRKETIGNVHDIRHEYICSSQRITIKSSKKRHKTKLYGNIKKVFI